MALTTVLRTDSATPFKFEKKGQTLVGHYAKTVQREINGKQTDVHLFQTKEGLVSVLGQWDLGQQLQSVPAGAYIEVTFVSIQKLKAGRTMKVYSVAYDPDQIINDLATATVDNSTSSNEDDSYPEAEDDSAEEEAPADEAPPARATRPASPAKAPSSESRASVAALLSKNRSRPTA